MIATAISVDERVGDVCLALFTVERFRGGLVSAGGEGGCEGCFGFGAGAVVAGGGLGVVRHSAQLLKIGEGYTETRVTVDKGGERKRRKNTTKARATAKSQRCT